MYRGSYLPWVAMWLALGAIFSSLAMTRGRATPAIEGSRQYQMCIQAVERHKDSLHFADYLKICGELVKNDSIRKEGK